MNFSLECGFCLFASLLGIGSFCLFASLLGFPYLQYVRAIALCELRGLKPKLF